MNKQTDFVFLGSSPFSVYCLNELKENNILPKLIITTPDKLIGRGLKLSPTPVKIWAQENKIDCLSPDKLDADLALLLKEKNYPLFLVASYGKIIPKIILDIPNKGTLNIHPSLLPKYRGASPLQTQILNDEKNIGVTIILLDEKMDHGPILAQEEIAISNWPISFDELEKATAKLGTKLFINILEPWLSNKITGKEQDHTLATFTQKVKKEDGLLDLTADGYKNYLKFLAYSDWPQTYFFLKRNNCQPGTLTDTIRIIVKDAEYLNGQFIIKRVVPEGKKEMDYQDFLRGQKQ